MVSAVTDVRPQLKVRLSVGDVRVFCDSNVDGRTVAFGQVDAQWFIGRVERDALVAQVGQRVDCVVVFITPSHAALVGLPGGGCYGIVEIGVMLSLLWPSAANVPRWQRPLVDALGPPRLSDAETPGLAAP